MKICNIVKNSIWYDPRVKKQIASYLEGGVELICIGVTDPRHDSEEEAKIPCKVDLVDIDELYYGKKRTIFTKISRELKTNKGIYKKILDAKPDVIHANDLNALIPAYKASKKLKCKIIYDTHEIFLENPWIARNKIVKFIWGFYEKKIIKKVDLVVCVSNAAAEYFKEKYNITKPTVVTNCISAKNHIVETPEKEPLKQILNHGQFYEGRGYDIMIDAAPLISDYKDLQLVLRGFGSLEDELHKKAEGFDNVYFAPPVKVEELIPMASHAWVGLAITEAISINFELSVSNKIFEYAAAGLPVIMSDIPEHRYLNGKYNFGIIIKENTPEEIAKAIKTFYDDEEFYNKCVENSKKMSAEVNWDREFEKLLKIEKNMLN